MQSFRRGIDTTCTVNNTAWHHQTREAIPARSKLHDSGWTSNWAAVEHNTADKSAVMSKVPSLPRYNIDLPKMGYVVQPLFSLPSGRISKAKLLGSSRWTTAAMPCSQARSRVWCMESEPRMLLLMGGSIWPAMPVSAICKLGWDGMLVLRYSD